MKKLTKRTIAALLAGAAVLHGAIISPQNITLHWTYPPSEVTPDLSFRLYTASVLGGPWTVLKTIPGTNTQTTISVIPAKAFYYLTASNFWGESDPSTVAGTPAPPVSGGTLSITKGP